MSTLQANNYYLSIDGTDLSSYVIEGSLTRSVAEQDITAGSSTTHVARGAGLVDHSFSCQLRASDSGEYSLALLTGVHTITWGKNGSATGKPKHVQSMIINSVSYTVNVQKPMVVHNISANGAATPTTDEFTGGVWS